MLKCEFCNSKKVLKIKKTSILLKEAILMRCTECSHVFKYDYEDILEKNIIEFYQTIHYNNNNVVKRQQQKQSNFLNKNNILKLPKDGNILEVGGGIHGLINMLDGDYQKYAFELNQNSYREIQQADVKILNSLINLDIKFKLIILSHVFEHIIEDPYCYILNLLDSVADDGSIFIEVPHISYELLFSKNQDIIFDNLTPAHARSDDSNSYISFLSRFKKDFIIEEEITLLWKSLLFFRNHYKKLEQKRKQKKSIMCIIFFFFEIIFRVITSLLFHFHIFLKQPNPNIKILIYN